MPKPLRAPKPKSLPYPEHHEVFARAISTTFQNIADDCEQAWAIDKHKPKLRDWVEVTLDANRVEMFGQLRGEAYTCWQAIYNDPALHALLNKFAAAVLKDYV